MRVDIRPEFVVVFSSSEISMTIKALLAGDTAAQRALGQTLDEIRQREADRWLTSLEESREANLRAHKLREEAKKSSEK